MQYSLRNIARFLRPTTHSAFAHPCRYFSASARRNLGIVAHVDGGKTTLTERFLYYSNAKGHIGEVDIGDTTTDFLEEEQERGITIQSACVSFEWKNNHINLIDTPGHVDFTVEVERSMRVLDGIVVVLDGCKGVEAQTETVWKQADRYGVPRIVAVNKMDKEGASLSYSANTIAKRFQLMPLIVQIPIGSGGTFRGAIDIVRMKKMEWNIENDVDGSEFSITTIDEDYPGVDTARKALIEALAEVDEETMDKYLESEEEGKNLVLSESELIITIRRVILSGNGTAIFCCSAFKNKGVQPILDAVVDYLPAPEEAKETYGYPIKANDVKQLIKDTLSTKNNKEMIKNHNNDVTQKDTIQCDKNKRLCALAFKVVYNGGRPYTFVRVYSGELTKRDSLVNLNNGHKEIARKLMRIQAGDMRDIDTCSAGDICAISGLVSTKTGDTITIQKSSLNGYVLQPITIPEPVFYVALEPETESEREYVLEALSYISTDDPSVVVQVEEYGQVLVKGMGELHIEIVVNRLKNEFKCKVDVGPIQISYREELQCTVDAISTFDGLMNGKQCTASVHFEIEPLEINDEGVQETTSFIDWNCDIQNIELKEAIQEGIELGLERGPLLGAEVIKTKTTVLSVGLENDHNNQHNNNIDANIDAFRMVSSQAIQKALEIKSNIMISEPVMEAIISVKQEYLGAVLGDLTSKRRAQIHSVENESEGNGLVGPSVIHCYVPLIEMMGYSSILRSHTQGNGHFHMQFSRYSQVTQNIQQELLG